MVKKKKNRNKKRQQTTERRQGIESEKLNSNTTVLFFVQNSKFLLKVQITIIKMSQMAFKNCVSLINNKSKKSFSLFIQNLSSASSWYRLSICRQKIP